MLRPNKKIEDTIQAAYKRQRRKLPKFGEGSKDPIYMRGRRGRANRSAAPTPSRRGTSSSIGGRPRRGRTPAERRAHLDHHRKMQEAARKRRANPRAAQRRSIARGEHRVDRSGRVPPPQYGASGGRRTSSSGGGVGKRSFGIRRGPGSGPNSRMTTEQARKALEDRRAQRGRPGDNMGRRNIRMPGPIGRGRSRTSGGGRVGTGLAGSRRRTSSSGGRSRMGIRSGGNDVRGVPSRLPDSRRKWETGSRIYRMPTPSEIREIKRRGRRSSSAGSRGGRLGTSDNPASRLSDRQRQQMKDRFAKASAAKKAGKWGSAGYYVPGGRMGPAVRRPSAARRKHLLSRSRRNRYRRRR